MRDAEGGENRGNGEMMILNIQLCYTRHVLVASRTVRLEYFRRQGDNQGYELKDEGLIRHSLIRECVY